MFSAINISGSGMSANQEWLELTANNISNMNTTRTENGGPYHRQTLSFESKSSFDDLFQKQIGDGVQVDGITEDMTEHVIYNPEHPDANEEGYVRMPAIDLAAEMSNMIMAQRAYEANVTSFNSIKQVMQKQLEIGRV